jgi:hypothetical protein
MNARSRRITVVAAIAVLTVLLALPASAQTPVEIGDTVTDYTEVGGVVIERPVTPPAPVVERGAPAVPTQVLGVQHRLAVTGGDVAVLAGLAALLLALGTVAIRSGRRTPAH